MLVWDNVPLNLTGGLCVPFISEAEIFSLSPERDHYSSLLVF